MEANETNISHGYKERASIEVEVFCSWENVITRRVAVRCIVLMPFGFLRETPHHESLKEGAQSQCQRPRVA